MRITCPTCHGSCVEKTGRRVQVTQHTYAEETVPCTGCNGQGWVEDGMTPVLPAPPPPDAQTSDGGTRIPKPRRAEGWLLAVGLLILVGLFGHLLNQQQLFKRTPDIVDEAPRPESPPVPAPAQRPPDTKALQS